MTAGLLIIGFVGFIQGFFFLPFILNFPACFIEADSLKSHYRSELLIYTLSVLFSCLVFFGIGIAWINFLFNENNSLKELGKTWLMFFFIGLVFLALIKKRTIIDK